MPYPVVGGTAWSASSYCKKEVIVANAGWVPNLLVSYTNLVAAAIGTSAVIEVALLTSIEPAELSSATFQVIAVPSSTALEVALYTTSFLGAAVSTNLISDPLMIPRRSRVRAALARSVLSIRRVVLWLLTFQPCAAGLVLWLVPV